MGFPRPWAHVAAPLSTWSVTGVASLRPFLPLHVRARSTANAALNRAAALFSFDNLLGLVFDSGQWQAHSATIVAKLSARLDRDAARIPWAGVPLSGPGISRLGLATFLF